jgi:hypothetical protein
LFTFAGRVCCGGDRNKKKKLKQDELAKGWRRQRLMRGRVRRGDGGSEGIEMRRLRASRSSSDGSRSSGDDSDGRTFDLPRANR